MTEQDFLAEMLKSLNISISQSSLEQLIRFQNELFLWNRRFNLTAITDPYEALEKHLLDSLTLLPFLKDNIHLLDIGSGGGFPGLPLKIVRETLELWSVDANGKKIAFQNHICRSLGLVGFHTCHARVENLSLRSFLPRFDMIVARAFSSIGSFLAVAKPLLNKKGVAVAMKGPGAERELTEASQELEELEMDCFQIHHLRLPVSCSERALLFFTSKKL
jgi:16S rRNA (guanine527-N7)-methyltransferase